MSNETKQILDELRQIRIEIEFIRETMPDKEMFLTAEEEKLLEKSYVDEEKGKLISSGDLRKELGI
ncbi:MAG: hypothetical protein ISS48_03170 [Candidatus Aenigmarchaeota archaeon]|nr:hypothetical protein [Candidatus Aenigmarchaeota archaeon]